MLKLSFNVHARNLKDKNKFLQWVKDNKPTAVLILNERQLASQCADLGVKYVILRLTNNDDDLQNKISSFQEWWGAVKNTYAEDKRLIVHFDNEPHGNWPRLNSFSMEGMKTLYNEGYHGVFANFGVGWPDSINNVSSMLHLLNTTYKDWHYLGVHEYYMTNAEQSIPFAIGRYKDIEELYPRVKYIITEFGSDDLGIPHLRGHKDYTDEQVLKDFKEIFNKFYNPDKNVLGVCTFCYGNSGGWDKYDFEGSNLVGRFKELVMNETVRIQPLDGAVNRRTGPTTAFPVNGQLTTTTVVTKLAVQEGWTQYQFSDGAFWLKDSVIRVLGSTVALNLYNAPEEDVERANALVKELLELLTKYKADVI